MNFLAPHGYRSCEASYPQETISIGGESLEAPFGDLYCFFDDDQYQSNVSPILDAILSRVDEVGSLKRIEIATNFLDGRFFSTFLCGLPLSAQTVLNVYVQRVNSRVEEAESHLDGLFLKEIERCISQVNIRFVGCDWFDGDTEQLTEANKCPERQTNSQHIKLLGLYGSKGSILVAGSGNFTTASLTSNIENWLAWFQSDPAATSVFDCAFHFLDRLSSLPQMTFFQQRSIFNACASISRPLPGVDLFVLPFSEQDFRSRLSREVTTSSAITVVGQFIQSEFLFAELMKVPSVRVTFLVDSAYFYANRDRVTVNRVTPEIADRLFKFASNRPNVEIRFLQVNHHYSVHGQANSVHLRTIWFETPTGSSLMIGSAHFRDGSWRSNTELQMFIDGGAALDYVDLVADLIARSVAASDLPERRSAYAVGVTP